MRDPDFDLHDVAASAVEYGGRQALRLIDPDGERRAGLAVLRDATLRDGTIELDVAGRRAPHAHVDDRGFIGIGFRMSHDGAEGELVWLRPENGRSDDQLRRNHSTQYASPPKWTWYRLRTEDPGRYESYVDLVPGAWTRMRVEVEGVRMRLYVHDAEQPCLVVDDLKLGEREGRIALWIGAGTEGFFSGLELTPALG